jgi:peptide/nickel transport system substrate-binding protein
MTEALDRRRFLRLGAASVATLGVADVLAACGGTSKSSTSSVADVGSGRSAGSGVKGGTLRFATSGGSNKDTPDPAKTLNNFTIISCCQLYDNLVRSDLDFKLSPALATDWSSSPDGKTWTFRLRDGVKFHDGRPLTSADVAYSIKRVLDPKIGSNALGTVQPFIKASGITTPDPTTIKFALEAPNVFWPLLMSQAAFGIAPDGTTDYTKGIGTGPFKLQTFQALASAKFVRNDDYWNHGRPLLDAVELSSVAEDATRIESVVSGSKDFVDNVTGTSVSRLTGAAKPLAIKAGGWVTLAAWRTAKPFDNPKVVEAMKLAQDRKKIMGVVAPSFGEPGADVPLPTTDPFYPAGLEARPYDPEKAKSLLKQAGYGSGLDVKLYAYQGDKLDAALAYKDTAKSAGINVKVVTWPHATYWDQVWMKKPFVGDSWARLHASIILPQAFGAKSSANESKFKDPKFDSLLLDALKTTDEAKQKELYGEAVTMINDSSSSLIPGWEPQIFGQSTKLSGVQFASGGAQIFFDQATLA